MANLTLTIDDGLLRAARIRALEQGTSVNALVRLYLEHFAGETRASEAVATFLERSARSAASSGPEGRAWTRDELHER
ncbi:MAG: hypothetical protein ABIR67_05850 [Gaiellaceae bacterium]